MSIFSLRKKFVKEKSNGKNYSKIYLLRSIDRKFREFLLNSWKFGTEIFDLVSPKLTAKGVISAKIKSSKVKLVI